MTWRCFRPNNCAASSRKPRPEAARRQAAPRPPAPAIRAFCCSALAQGSISSLIAVIGLALYEAHVVRQIGAQPLYYFCRRRRVHQLHRVLHAAELRRAGAAPADQSTLPDERRLDVHFRCADRAGLLRQARQRDLALLARRLVPSRLQRARGLALRASPSSSTGSRPRGASRSASSWSAAAISRAT